MTLDRPLIFLDLESEGPGEPDPATDRIVSIGMSIVQPDGSVITKKRLVNPEIPTLRTRIHGITAEMVADAPTFRQIARGLHMFLVFGPTSARIAETIEIEVTCSPSACDLATYNGNNYDILLLWEEFHRAGIDWNVSAHRHIDVAALWRKMEPRTLADAARRFAGIERAANAHDAAEDADITRQVYFCMLGFFDIAQKPVNELADLTRPTITIGDQECARIDLAGVIARRPDGVAVYTHKKVRGVPVADDLGYADWILRSGFSANTHAELERELAAISKKEDQEESEPMDFYGEKVV